MNKHGAGTQIVCRNCDALAMICAKALVSRTAVLHRSRLTSLSFFHYQTADFFTLESGVSLEWEQK